MKPSFELTLIVTCMFILISSYLYLNTFAYQTTHVRKSLFHPHQLTAFDTDYCGGDGTKQPVIPKRIVTTIRDRSVIPDHIYEQYALFAPNHELHVYEDEDCTEFLETHYTDHVVERFRSLKKGAHKADLFRYAYLYIHGGVYLDIKTVLLYDIESIIDHDEDSFYMVFTNQTAMYNGILATPPKNPYFLHLLDDVINGPPLKDYLRFCKAASTILKEYYVDQSYTEHIKGLRQTVDGVPNVHLWKEIFCDAEKFCDGATDRYGLCNFVADERDTKIFKLRDPEYGVSWV